LIANVTPVQYAIRLLIPRGSRLLELPAVQELVDPFDDAALCYPWTHPDPRVDVLYQEVRDQVTESQRRGEPRELTYARVWDCAVRVRGEDQRPRPRAREAVGAPSVPCLSEAWYCCAEPIEEQGLARL
jgi:hypothetical protein